MHADIDGAIRIARLAAGFDWTWTNDNLEQFCRIANWQKSVRDDFGAKIQTDLNISSPGALAVSDDRFCRYWLPEGQFVYITAGLTDSPVDDSPETQLALIDGFSEIHSQIHSEFGKSWRLPGNRPRVFWDLPNVALVLTADFDYLEISLEIANTTYQHQQNLVYEDDGDDEDVGPSVISTPSSPTWPEFTTSLALTLSRMPEGGLLDLTIDDELGAQISMRRYDLSGAIVHGDTGVVEDVQVGATSRNQVPWPAKYSDLHEFADRITTRLRETHKVATPSEMLAEAWVDSYRCVPDITPLGDTERVDR